MTVLDLFCGGGGASVGILRATPRRRLKWPRSVNIAVVASINQKPVDCISSLLVKNRH